MTDSNANQDSGKPMITSALLGSCRASDVLPGPLALATVARLGDDGGDIVVGDPVTFCTVVTFCFPTFTLALNDRGEIVSPTKHPVKEDDVTRWLQQNFTFTFTLANDIGRTARDRDDLLRPRGVPWIRVLDTSGLPADVLEVGVTVAAASASPATVVRSREATLKTLSDEIDTIGEQLLRKADETHRQLQDVNAALGAAPGAASTPTSKIVTGGAGGTPTSASAPTPVLASTPTGGGPSPASPPGSRATVFGLMAGCQASLTALATSLDDPKTGLPPIVSALSMGTQSLADLKSSSAALGRQLDEHQKKTQTDFGRLQNVVTERIAETQLQIQALREGFERFAAFQEMLEVLDWRELGEILRQLSKERSRDKKEHHGRP